MNEKKDTAVKKVDASNVPVDGPGIHLSEPVDFEGEPISFISTDFNTLKGVDLRNIAKEYKARFHPKNDDCFFLDSNYLILMFSRVNKLPTEFFDKLNGRDYLALTEFYKLGVSESLKA